LLCCHYVDFLKSEFNEPRHLVNRLTYDNLVMQQFILGTHFHKSTAVSCDGNMQKMNYVQGPAKPFFSTVINYPTGPSNRPSGPTETTPDLVTSPPAL